MMVATLLRGDETCQREDSCERRLESFEVAWPKLFPSGTRRKTRQQFVTKASR